MSCRQLWAALVFGKKVKAFSLYWFLCQVYSICCCWWWCCFAEDERTAKRYCKINNNACVRSAKSQFWVLEGPASVVLKMVDSNVNRINVSPSFKFIHWRALSGLLLYNWTGACCFVLFSTFNVVAWAFFFNWHTLGLQTCGKEIKNA